jgi:hypothetical protein
MSPPEDTDTARESGDDSRDSRRTLRDHLLSFLETVADADAHGTQRREGTVDRGRSTIAYEYAVTVGLPSPEEHGTEGDATNRTTGADTDVVDVSAHGSTERRIETRHHGDGVYTLVAALPDTAATAVEAVVNETGAELQLLMDGAVVERISVDPQDTTITDAAVTNGILTVRLRQTENP